MDDKAEVGKTEEMIQHTRELRERYELDPHRPRYHFMPPWGWMNDINGAIFWKGRYHVFYQFNPSGAFHWDDNFFYQDRPDDAHDPIHWGHASSMDLVHWVHHPVALTPTPDGPDRDGCWSGGAFASKEGSAAFIYHGEPGGTCIATSEDDMLIRWAKHSANPVVLMDKLFGSGTERNTALDPCAWLAGDTYYALIGNYVPGVEGDGTNLFSSQDMARWEHLGPFYRSDRRWTEADEDCAVPDFFPLGDKHMLLFGSHVLGTQYYLGRLEGERYHPEQHARLNWPWGALAAPKSLLDGKGRRIYFDWIREFRGGDRERASGWSGVMTLPRVLSLAENGTLRIEPAPELQMLRMNPRVHGDLRVEADSEVVVDDVRGDCMELALEIRPEGCREFGLKVRSSPDGAEQTAVLYDASSGKLKVDVSRSTTDDGIRYLPFRGFQPVERLPEELRTVKAQEAPFDLAPGESLNLRVFIDRSVVEVFANGRQCLTQRVYPKRPDSLDVLLFSRGGSASVKTLQAWDMAPAIG